VSVSKVEVSRDVVTGVLGLESNKWELVVGDT